MNPLYTFLANPAHAAAGFWVLLGSAMLDLLGLVLLAVLLRRGALWVWRQARSLAGPMVSSLAWQWSTRPVRRCICCRHAETETLTRTRAEVFGPLAEFGPIVMPRRQPQHVPPQVLPWPVEVWEPRNDGYPWFDAAVEFAEPADVVPLSFDAFAEQCWAEHDREFGGAQ